MKWHDFIFSDKPVKRWQRHLLFWMAWWLYFSLCDYLYQLPIPTNTISPFYLTTGSFPVLKNFLLILVYAGACYTFINLLLPQIIKRKWWKAAATMGVLLLSLFGVAYFLYWNVFPLIDSLTGSIQSGRKTAWFWPPVSLGLITPLKIIAAAAILKYIKYWWLKKKESEQLEREKINAELQLLKAQIRPGFLFTALNNIYDYSLTASPHAPELLLKLSDLLSYMLYECEETYVPLEKEIGMMKDYIALENLRRIEAVETELTVSGDMNGKMIAPFLLLPFIENSFKQNNWRSEQAWINMDISIEENSLRMKLANGMEQEEKSTQRLSSNGLSNVEKRLTLLYPQKHELRISREQEMLIVFLTIQLTDAAITARSEEEKPPVTEPISIQPTTYAAS